jgi:hypothetical protein
MRFIPGIIRGSGVTCKITSQRSKRENGTSTEIREQTEKEKAEDLSVISVYSLSQPDNQ